MPRTTRGAVTLAEERPRTRRRRWAAGVVTVAVLGVVVAGGWIGVQRLVHAVTGEQCRVTAAGAAWDWAPDQASNAAAITAIAVKRDLPPRAASIAIATAMQESKVRNVRFGDRDSLGLFQQRPSQGWGSAEQILDPEYSTNKFYDALEKVDGYASMEIADAAQAVQRSAAGEAYAQHEGKARATASVLSGQTHAGIGCALRDPDTEGSPQDVAALLTKDFGLKGTVDGSTVRVSAPSRDLAWAVGSWAVARATDTGVVGVSTDGRTWTRSMEDAALSWSRDGDAGQREVVIRLA
ncbi:hypothetical protein [Phycicoccus sonneratiae]|uniref:Heavy metal transporter n=1 Tax=Phycicoccus sonneratiae TaxID=2807628 RepID=A0ABS2CNV5_9MICO|nr:hypothetical protein [Phycicoccus sonneraticus]MBM6400841.1 hypothetical protein [Phycicoccus sonneraticus]